MGTNYYLVDKKTAERKHIGKNSCGWVFMFSTDIGYCFADWGLYIDDIDNYYIINEYDEIVSVGYMWEVIYSQKNSGRRDIDSCITIVDGFMLCSGEFC